MSRLLVASRNAKKLNELRRVVQAAGIDGLEIVGLDEVSPFPETPETGATFAENAIVKAVDGWRSSGLPCLADDSGLCVDALNGMPGVLSARWAGGHGDDEANLRLLLAQMGDVPAERRGAGFVSVCALVSGGAERERTVVTGEWRGVIATEPRGESGFGYDPIFVPDDAAADGRSAAELTAAQKDSMSHRGLALTQLIPALRAMSD